MLSKNTQITIGSVCAAFLAIPAFSYADDAALERKLQSLEQEIRLLKDDLESKTVRAGESAGSFRLPGRSTELSVGGFIHLEVAAGENGSGLPNNPGFAPSLLNTPFGEVEGRSTAVDWTARRSRLWLKTSTPTEDDRLNTYVEIDFYGADGTESFTHGHAPRLRRAFATYGNWLVGQEFTTFFDFAAAGEVINFGGHANLVQIRQPQVRYTLSRDWGSLKIAAENSYEDKVVTLSNSVADSQKDDQKYPDVILRADIPIGDVHTSWKVMGRMLTMDNPASQGDVDDETLAGAFSSTVRLPVADDSLTLEYHYGALGRYVSLSAHPDAFVDDGNIEAFNSWGVSAQYTHKWGGKWNWRTTAVYAHTEADENMSGMPAGVAKSTSTGIVNLFWSPMQSTSLGVEYGYYELDANQIGTYSVSRINLSAQYGF